MSTTTLEPRDASEAAAMLASAAGQRTPLVPWGRGTRPASDMDNGSARLSSLKLTDGFAHYAGDLVATIPAGMTLAAANRALSGERQWLPLDPLTGDDGTIGGLVAANDSGPRRQGFGNPRDLIIGVQVALTTGVVAQSGGRVVKNVAGYDLARLFCGSRGSLGLVTSVTFKLAPQPPASLTLACRYDTLDAAARGALALSRSPLTPSCLEVTGPEPLLLVRFETTPSSAARMAEAAAALLGAGPDVPMLQQEDEVQAWRVHRERFLGAPVIAKLSVLPVRMPALLSDLTRTGVTAISARAALGVVDVAATGVEPLPALAAAAARHGGHVDVTRGPAGSHVHATPVASAAAIMRAVKQRFDPAGILPFPWGRA